MPTNTVLRAAALGFAALFTASCGTAPAAAPPAATAQNTPSPPAPSPTDRDMECMGATTALLGSQDANERDASLSVFGFYLGRLSQDGLTAEQIQTGMEKIAMSPRPEMRAEGFASACRDTMNTLLKQMNAVGARDVDKAKANPPSP
jgi:hypothetical protein